MPLVSIVVKLRKGVASIDKLEVVTSTKDRLLPTNVGTPSKYCSGSFGSNSGFTTEASNSSAGGERGTSSDVKIHLMRSLLDELRNAHI